MFHARSTVNVNEVNACIAGPRNSVTLHSGEEEGDRATTFVRMIAHGPRRNLLVGGNMIARRVLRPPAEFQRNTTGRTYEYNPVNGGETRQEGGSGRVASMRHVLHPDQIRRCVGPRKYELPTPAVMNYHHNHPTPRPIIRNFSLRPCCNRPLPCPTNFSPDSIDQTYIFDSSDDR